MSPLQTSIHLRRPTLITLSATTVALASLTFIAPRPSTPSSPALRTMSTSPTFPVRTYTSQRTKFPYSQADLTPRDPSNDSAFYSSPRFVTHIDDHAIGLLRKYYASILPKSVSVGEGNRRRPRVLDLCSSWISHYPSTLEAAARAGEDTGMDIAGTGMSAAELRENPLFRGKDQGNARWVVKDLNKDPSIPPLETLFPPQSTVTPPATETEQLLDTTTLTVSIDYLTQPVAVLSSLLKHTCPGGTVHLAISNRCFPTKAVSRWLHIDEEERLQMVGDYLWFAGWRDVEIVTLSDGRLEAADNGAQPAEQGSLRRLMALMGVSGDACDPLWVVRARRVDEASGKI